MSKNSKWWMTGMAVALTLPVVASAAESARNFHVVNRFRAEYDDNYTQTENNEQDSFKFIEQVDLMYNLNLDQTFLSLRYEPSFVYWTDRDDDDNDLHHAFDGILNHAFTPRLSLSLKDTFRFAENPELMDREAVVRQSNDYTYNTGNAALSYLLSEQTRVEAAGRIVTLTYDDDEVGDYGDYDIYVGGLTLRHAWKPETALLGEARYEDLQYANDLRDSQTIYVGAGAEHTFNPSFLGSLRAGLQSREFDSTVRDSKDTPYVDASVTLLPTPATRISSGVSYSQYETDIAPYASQERTRFYVSLAHDLTARISGYLTGAYTDGEYDRDETPTGDVTDGSEERVQVSARATYKVNMAHHLELGYQFNDLSSDLRNDYTRNRVNVGWVWQL